MKIVIFVIAWIFLITSINCFTQSDEKIKKEFKSKTRYVYGYSSDFNETFYLGITFEKVLNSVDTSYYIKFDLSSTISEYLTDICLNKANSITFLAKSGRSVDLKLADVSSLINSDKQTDDPFTPVKVSYYYTTLKFEVTKKVLIKISSDPFYRIILPYFICSSKVYNKLEFICPTLFTRRTFIQKNINYILDI